VTIENLTLSYPDFQAGAVINPEEFDQNNNEIVTKINELVDSENADVAALTAHKTGTDHDARYYTEAEADAKFATIDQMADIVLRDIPANTLTGDRFVDETITVDKLAFSPLTTLPTAGGSANALTLSQLGYALSDGAKVEFIAAADNNAAATTIDVNSTGVKNVYKPGTTAAPLFISGKAYTLWYDATGDCFFIKASAEGTATVAKVLAGESFSNVLDVGLIGEMPNLAGDSAALASSVVGTTLKLRPPTGFKDGIDDTVSITDANFVASKITYGDSIFGLEGTAVKPSFNAIAHYIATTPASNIVYSINYNLNLYTNSTTPVKLGRRFTTKVAGTFTIVIDLSLSGGYAYAQIYKNGVASSRVFSTSYTSDNYFYYDVSLAIGDYIDIYCNHSVGGEYRTYLIAIFITTNPSISPIQIGTFE
jgi:hypothetical protein